MNDRHLSSARSVEQMEQRLEAEKIETGGSLSLETLHLGQCFRIRGAAYKMQSKTRPAWMDRCQGQGHSHSLRTRRQPARLIRRRFRVQASQHHPYTRQTFP